MGDVSDAVAVTYPDGFCEVFDLKAEYTDPVFRTGSEVRLKYVPRYGPNWTLEALDVDFVYFNRGKIEYYDIGRAHVPITQVLDPALGPSPLSDAGRICGNQPQRSSSHRREPKRRNPIERPPHNITANAMITERVNPDTGFRLVTYSSTV